MSRSYTSVPLVACMAVAGQLYGVMVMLYSFMRLCANNANNATYMYFYTTHQSACLRVNASQFQ
jgi:hypothetical protein